MIFIFISQIDRRHDAEAAPPGIADVRMPNEIDTSLFNKADFLRDGEVVSGGP